MADIRDLSRKSKVFLAGTMKSMILADGRIEFAELNDVDRIVERHGFDDYEECMEEFERSVENREQFEALGKTIDDPTHQDVILNFAEELAIQDGYRDRNQGELLQILRRMWGRE